jgi:hypothetical protein
MPEHAVAVMHYFVVSVIALVTAPVVFRGSLLAHDSADTIFPRRCCSQA